MSVISSAAVTPSADAWSKSVFMRGFEIGPVSRALSPARLDQLYLILGDTRAVGEPLLRQAPCLAMRAYVRTERTRSLHIPSHRSIINMRP